MSGQTAFAAPQELHDLAFRYGLAVDNGDAAMLGSVFTADGTIRGLGQAVPRYAGAAGWTTMIAEVRASFARTMHNVFNQTFEIDALQTVTGLTTGIASHILPTAGDAGEWTLIDFAMRYHNRYVVDGGFWKFADRQLEVVWVEQRTVTPFTAAMLGRELGGFKAGD